MTTNQPETDKEEPEREEWTVVSKQDKKRVMRKRRGPARIRTKNIVSHPTATMQGPLEEAALLQQTLSACRQQLIQTQFFQHCIDIIVDANCWSEILCLGLGNFTKTQTVDFSASLWQLACAVELQQACARKKNMILPEQQAIEQESGRDDTGSNEPTTNVPRITFYDPASTPAEIDFLVHHLKAQVHSTNQHGKYTIERPTIVYMPHCPVGLYENMVTTNSRQNNEVPWGVLGNSLVNHSEALQPSVPIPQLKAHRQDFIERPLKYTTRDAQETTGNFIGAFNDTYWTTLISPNPTLGNINTKENE